MGFPVSELAEDGTVTITVKSLCNAGSSRYFTVFDDQESMLALGVAKKEIAKFFKEAGENAAKAPATHTTINVPGKIAHEQYLESKEIKEELIVGARVTEIGMSAFANIKQLKSVVFEDGVTSIGFCSFSGCTALASVSIPDSVTKINQCAFDGTALTAVSIPAAASYNDGHVDNFENDDDNDWGHSFPPNCVITRRA